MACGFTLLVRHRPLWAAWAAEPQQGYCPVPARPLVSTIRSHLTTGLLSTLSREQQRTLSLPRRTRRRPESSRPGFPADVQARFDPQNQEICQPEMTPTHCRACTSGIDSRKSGRPCFYPAMNPKHISKETERIASYYPQLLQTISRGVSGGAQCHIITPKTIDPAPRRIYTTVRSFGRTRHDMPHVLSSVN